jgi:hypothetical protein
VRPKLSYGPAILLGMSLLVTIGPARAGPILQHASFSFGDALVGQNTPIALHAAEIGSNLTAQLKGDPDANTFVVESATFGEPSHLLSDFFRGTPEALIISFNHPVIDFSAIFFPDAVPNPSDPSSLVGVPITFSAFSGGQNGVLVDQEVPSSAPVPVTFEGLANLAGGPFDTVVIRESIPRSGLQGFGITEFFADTLAPVPEPPTLSTLLLGTIGLVLVHSRRRAARRGESQGEHGEAG